MICTYKVQQMEATCKGNPVYSSLLQLKRLLYAWDILGPEIWKMLLLLFLLNKLPQKRKPQNVGLLLNALHIWVHFLRTGIGPELCDFFKKFGWLLWPNVKKNNFLFNWLWEIFFTKVLGKTYGSLWHHITTLHYTTLHLKMPSFSTLH